MDEVGSVREWTDIANRQERGEDNTIPRFYMRAVQDPLETERQNRPIYKEVPYVEIIVPGDKNNRPDVKVTDEHKRRWPVQWEKFQISKREVLEGTPIESWPLLNRAQVAEFKALGILTVESLAGLDDLGVQKLGPYGLNMRQRAKQHIQPPSMTEGELRSENRQLKQQLEAVTARLENLERNQPRQDHDFGAAPVQPKKRGRPPKVATVEPDEAA